MAVIDHLGLKVSDIARSKAFYSAVLEPLGFTLLMDFGVAVGFGRDGKPEFWIGTGEPVTTALHVAFTSPSRAQVTAFYQAALAAGAKDNGPPGLRTMYHPEYFGAFAIDPDGNNIEACCHHPE